MVRRAEREREKKSLVILVRVDDMEFWPEFLATSFGKEFVAGGFGGMAGVVSGHPLDTLRIRLQQPTAGAAGGGNATAAPSATKLLKRIVKAEGVAALFRGMTAPLGTVALQNAVVFQVFALLSKALNGSDGNPAPYKAVAIAGLGTGALQTLTLTPVELVKIRLQLQMLRGGGDGKGPLDMARKILRREGLRGLYRGYCVTMLRDAPAHCAYFWTYEYTREKLHPGCRKTGEESLGTMLLAGGMAGISSWVTCYPLDVVKSRLQGQQQLHGPQQKAAGGGHSGLKYAGIVDCLRRSVREEGYRVLWRGLGTTIARAFVVNGAIFSGYEVALRFMANKNGFIRIAAEEA